MHLIGNMIFLWAFGIIVEGKLGWWAFTLVYLGIGVAENAGIQLLLHPQSPCTCLVPRGPSTACWPCAWSGRPRTRFIASFSFERFRLDVDLSILWFVAFYIGMEFLEFGMRGFSISSAMAHLGGAILGFGLAVVLLKLKLVDCENWDIFAVMEGRQGETRKRRRKRRSMMIRPAS